MKQTSRLRRLATAATLLATLGAASSLTACNTIAGAGDDVKAAGQGVSNGATAVKNGGN